MASKTRSNAKPSASSSSSSSSSSMPKPGDKVRWNTSQGPTTGTVRKVLKGPADIKGHHVAASPDHPELLISSDKSGAAAAHKPGSVRKVSK